MKKKILIALMCLPTLLSPYILGRIRYQEALDNIEALSTHLEWGGTDSEILTELRLKKIYTDNVFTEPSFIELYQAGLR